MPNPKRRHSKARTSKRRAHDHLTVPAATTCQQCGADKLPHRVCTECGYYRDREVIEVETE
jgi:large subunit ribosomal protein L32